MKRTEFGLRILTPMFMAGENQAGFELRPPSLKGMMRFWWRAYCWGKHSEKQASKEIEEKEGQIFGTASGKGLKSSFSIRTKTHNEGTLDPFPKRLVQTRSGGRTFPINILEYLAYGTYGYQRGKGNVFNRPYLPAGSEFSVTLNAYDDTLEKDMIISFYFLSVFGGIGAKSRNGFGNFVIEKIRLEEGDPTFGELGLQNQFPFPKPDFLDEIIQNRNLPDFSAFSRNMRIFKLNDSCGSWDECLGRLGEIYRESKGKLDEKLRCDKRQYIASPITIQKRVGGRWRTYDRSFLERHSKPYFLRVVRTRNGFDGYVIHLPSKYCEGLDKDRNKNRIDHSEANEKFHEYCNEFNEYLGKRMGIFYG